MIVFNLACAQQHLFEGWFGSSDDFESQRQRGLVECPVCGNKVIEKRLSAPRLNLGAAAPAIELNSNAPTPTQSASGGGNDLPAATKMLMPQDSRSQALVEHAQNMWMEMAKQVIANTEDVGSSFAEEARKIHYREAPERGIRGQATADEAEALRDEGIAVASLHLPDALKRPLQ
jgi:hypothetical protein